MTLKGTALKEVKAFTYPDSIIDSEGEGGTDADFVLSLSGNSVILLLLVL